MHPPIIDGHNDSLHRLAPYSHEDVRDFFTQHTEGHIDLPRARAGGLGGGFFAVFIPSQPSSTLPAPMEVIVTPNGYEVPLAAPLDLAAAQQATIAMTAGLLPRSSFERPDQGCPCGERIDHVFTNKCICNHSSF